MDPETIAAVAREENVDKDWLAGEVQSGRVVILGRPELGVRPIGVGRGLRVKVNANIGTSPEQADLDVELRKLRAAVSVGADTTMDLSTGGDLDGIRKAIREHCPVPLGTVPIYQAAAEAEQRYGDFGKIPVSLLLDVIERHAADGVDFMTLHCGVTQAGVELIEKHGRLCGIVSRGGALIARWMRLNNAENPLYSHYDEVLEICKRHGVAVSLGDGLRPGCLADASDAAQLHETMVLGELVLRAREAGVQVFVEGPGHMPMNQIAANVVLMKRLCYEAPFYVLGPLVTDVAPGYDHITGAIGGAICAMAGADFLCYVTPAEHLGLPGVDDVIEGVIAARIAAHAADVARGLPGARDWDDRISRARAARDWEAQAELAIDPGKVHRVRSERPARDPRVCTMCGKFCSMKIFLEDDLHADSTATTSGGGVSPQT
ncbi:MAG: phosphomethylpyrimidine synthase ThiC [Armatimonadetes bacterium]|nr:phosphomethylpyrimidine synthase ThiC [Armatimonadota bacterium]